MLEGVLDKVSHSHCQDCGESGTASKKGNITDTAYINELKKELIYYL
jgi:hypothetical protein